MDSGIKCVSSLKVRIFKEGITIFKLVNQEKMNVDRGFNFLHFSAISRVWGVMVHSGGRGVIGGLRKNIREANK